jgi:hypothetical protein
MPRKIWRPLGNANRGRLTFLGSAVAALCGAGWQLYLHVATTTPDISPVRDSLGAPLGPALDANIRSEVVSDGDIHGNRGIDNIDISCSGKVTISQVLKSGGSIKGGSSVSGVKLTGSNCTDKR